MHRDQKGFSLVELIVVIGISAILLGASLSMLSSIRYANAQKAAETIASKLDSQRVVAMTKSGKSYLYIYKLDDGIYMKVLPTKYAAFNESAMDDEGSRIANNTMRIYIMDKDENKTEILKKSGFICVEYNRSGVFTDSTNVFSTGQTEGSIYLDGGKTYKILLMKETGKYFM